MYVPFLINFPSGFMAPTFLADSLLIDSLFAITSNFKCSIIFISCSSVGDLLRNSANFPISPRKS